MTRLIEKVPQPIRRDLRLSWKGMMRRLRSWKWPALILTIAVALVAFFLIFPNDREWFRWIRGDMDPELREFAQAVGGLGSYAQYNLAVVLGLWLAGKIWRSRSLQRLAAVVVVTTVAAGLFCNVFRFGLGRARPFTGEEPMQFYGPQIHAKYHGFPSGHTSTAFGTAIPILMVRPEIGVPVTAFAGLMGWARIYDKAHYPGDVLVGAYIGTLFGMAGGLPLRRVLKRGRRLRKSRKKQPG